MLIFLVFVIDQTLIHTNVCFSLAVPDPGLSPAAVAGIVVAVLLVSAAVAAGVMYFCRPRTSNLPSQTCKCYS